MREIGYSIVDLDEEENLNEEVVWEHLRDAIATAVAESHYWSKQICVHQVVMEDGWPKEYEGPMWLVTCDENWNIKVEKVD